MSPNRTLRHVARMIALFLPIAIAAAQDCSPRILPGDPTPGDVMQAYSSTLWDPDGPGAAPPELVIATGPGLLARIDDAWTPLGSITTVGGCIATLNGRLVAARRTDTGIVIAEWNGTEWIDLSPEFDGAPQCVRILPGGELVVGGNISVRLSEFESQSTPVAILKNGAWTPLGERFATSDTNRPPRFWSLLVRANGHVIALGDFVRCGDTLLNGIAEWDGSAWVTFADSSPVGEPVYYYSAILELPDGDIILAGESPSLSSQESSFIARWDGAAWHSVGTVYGQGAFTQRVWSTTLSPSGDLLVAGTFSSIDGVQANAVARWNGSVWSALGSGLGNTYSDFGSTVTTLCAFPDGRIFASGDFCSAGQFASWNTAMFDGVDWQPMHQTVGFNAQIRVIKKTAENHIIAGGSFLHAGETHARHIARWNGAHWSPLGEGFSLPVSTVAVMTGGDVLAYGYGPGPDWVNLLSRWDGSRWTPILESSHFGINDILPLPGDRALIAGVLNLNGTRCMLALLENDQLTPLLPSNGIILCLASSPNGEIYLGGNFRLPDATAQDVVARGDGTNWSGVSANLDTSSSTYINHLEVSPAGVVHAIGYSLATGKYTRVFSKLGQNSWNPITLSSSVSAILDIKFDTQGLMYFIGGYPGIRFGSYDGSTFRSLGIPNGGVQSILPLPHGQVAAAGGFISWTDTPAAFFARYAATLAPWTVDPPQSVEAIANETTTISITPAPDYPNVRWAWLRDGAAVHDGPGGASIGGGTVSGASGTLLSPTDAAPLTLTISGTKHSDAGRYTLALSNSCGGNESAPASLAIRCNHADRNADGVLTLEDFIDFFDCWNLELPCANLDTFPEIDLRDFFLFFNDFDHGC